MSFKAHPNKQVSGQMQTGILVRINNQSFSCATLRGNGMGLWTVVPPEEEEEEEAETEVAGGLAGGDWEGEVIGCGLSHITPHSVPGWPSVTTQANPIQREKKYTQNPSLTNAWILYTENVHHLSVLLLWQCCHVLSVLNSVYILPVLISLPTSIRSLTTDHVIIQLTLHQITSGGAWQLPIHISLSLFLSRSVG